MTAWVVGLIMSIAAQIGIFSPSVFVPQSASGVSIVQPTSGNQLAAGCGYYAATISCTMPVNVTSGNILRVYFGAQTTGTISSIPAKSSGTATVGTCSATGGGSTSGGVQQWYSCAITGSGSLTLSATFSATNNLVLFPFEIASDGGLDSGTNPTYSSGSCFATACSNSSITTATANDLVINIAAGGASNTYSAYTPYASISSSNAPANNVNFILGKYTAVSTGAVGGTFTTNTTINYLSSSLAIK